MFDEHISFEGSRGIVGAGLASGFTKLVSIHFYKLKFVNFLWDGHPARPDSAT
ncbi:hypothetical protein IQ272_29080 [Chroococcidiopsidales cyanobacterium LEGE 13417]|uniref:hypothetical protein n=1 Tax=Chroococcidiopsis sp. CCALA 051 TaxID=869949 RepID=UPI001304BF36|nr:hypothetical protein [Chroococcidiopsis sp. CCALA 051]MBE9020113.1 hypothetical protein [Chroococcidiopsidales cyanobacterium LEGE 13417]